MSCATAAKKQFSNPAIKQFNNIAIKQSNNLARKQFNNKPIFNMNPTLLILAAGIGSRYGGLKQAEGVGPSGEAILDYSIYDAIRAGFEKVVFVIRRDIESDMKKIFFEKWSTKIDIDYVFQETSTLPQGYSSPEGRIKPWGTGHAVWVAREKIMEPFAMINADDFYGRASFKLAFDFLSEMDNLLNSRYALIGYSLKNTLSDHGHVSRAECTVDEAGNLKSITERLRIHKTPEGPFYEKDGERLPLDREAVVSMNMWGFMPSIFEYLEEDLIAFLQENSQSEKAEFLLPNVIDRLINSGIIEIPVLHSDEKWFGMTYREDLELVKSRLSLLVSQGSYPDPVWG
jgi:dTDP-glucose pyrophosphorylase